MIRGLLLMAAIMGKKKREPQPWEGTGNYHVISASLIPSFAVSQVQYRNAYGAENISAGISDVVFAVSHI